MKRWAVELIRRDFDLATMKLGPVKVQERKFYRWRWLAELQECSFFYPFGVGGARVVDTWNERSAETVSWSRNV